MVAILAVERRVVVLREPHSPARRVEPAARSKIFSKCPDDASRYARCEKGHGPRVGDAAAAALMRVSSMTAAVIA